MTSPSQEILNACTLGDVAALQRLCSANNLPNSDPVYQDSPCVPPPVNSMLTAAIPHGHVDVVSLILQTYPGRKIQFSSESITSLLQHPNIDILKLLYEHDPYVTSFEWDGHTDTFVTKACEQPPEKITPLLMWLIEHDADMEGGHFPRALCCAIEGGQALGVMEAMVKKGARISTLAMRQAVVFERMDVIKFLIASGLKVDGDSDAYIQDEAEKTGDREIIETVERWMSSKRCVVS